MRNFRGCTQPLNSFISQGFIFTDQVIFDFSPNKVPFVLILSLRVLHVRLMYFWVCKIQFFFCFVLFFFGGEGLSLTRTFTISNFFAAPLGVRNSRCRLYFSFNLELCDFFVMCFFNIRKLIWLIIYLNLLSLLIYSIPFWLYPCSY